MTDQPPSTPLPEPPEDEADLLASLYLDGEATPEERRRVESDPGLVARVEAFRALAAQTAEVSVPHGLAETHIAAALEAYDARSHGAIDAPSTVTSLTQRRARRSGLPAWLGAAAAAVLVVGGLGFVATRGSQDDDEAASFDTAVSASPSNAAASAETEAADLDSAELESDLDDSAISAESGSGDSAALEESAEADETADDTAEDSADEQAPAEDEATADDGARQPLSPEEAADFYLANGPVDLSQLEAGSAADYYNQLADLPLRPIDDSPCADSEVVVERSEIDSFIPVIFDQQEASLVVDSDFPVTALVIGPGCEIELS